MSKIPRLYIQNHTLGHLSSPFALSIGHHTYLRRVLRLRAGDWVRVFDGQTGEFLARLAPQGDALDRAVRLRTQEGAWVPLPPEPKAVVEADQALRRLRETLGSLTTPTSVGLAFGVIKKTRLPFLLEKATELGVASLQPLITQHTQESGWNAERAQRIVEEAAEQSERLNVPRLLTPCTLEAFLDQHHPCSGAFGHPTGPRITSFMDHMLGETLSLPSQLSRTSTPEQESMSPAYDDLHVPTDAIPLWWWVVGPEGGLTDQEIFDLETEGLCPVSLGPGILRTETAALCMLSHSLFCLPQRKTLLINIG